MPRKATGKPDGRPPKGPRSGLSERINTRCTPEVKAAIKAEMARSGLSEGQLVEMILRHHLSTHDTRAIALGTLVTQMISSMSRDMWQTSENTPWFDDPYKHACISSAVRRLLERLKPEGSPKASEILLRGLEAYGMEHFAEPSKAGAFTVGNIAKRWDNTDPDPAATFDDLSYIKAMLKTGVE